MAKKYYARVALTAKQGEILAAHAGLTLDAFRHEPEEEEMWQAVIEAVKKMRTRKQRKRRSG